MRGRNAPARTKGRSSPTPPIRSARRPSLSRWTARIDLIRGFSGRAVAITHSERSPIIAGAPPPPYPRAACGGAPRCAFRFGAPCVLALTVCGMTWRACRVEFPLRVPLRPDVRPCSAGGFRAPPACASRLCFASPRAGVSISPATRVRGAGARSMPCFSYLCGGVSASPIARPRWFAAKPRVSRRWFASPLWGVLSARRGSLGLAALGARARS